MKTTLLCVFAIVVANTVFAQNWSPINTEETFYYNSGGDELTGIRVDSVSIIGADTVWFTNLFAQLHPELESPDNMCSEESIVAIAKASFIQSEVIVLEGGVYLFQNPDTFQINTLAVLGDEWIYSEMWGEEPVMASITDNAEMDVLGVIDSIKTITLSDGRMLLLSKNHGWVEFESDEGDLYTLSGIPDRQLGEYPIGRHEIFDFEVGDVFVYLRGSSYADLLHRGLVRIEILDVTYSDNDIVVVTAQRTTHLRNWQLVNDGGFYYHDETSPSFTNSQVSSTISLSNRQVSDAVKGTFFIADDPNYFPIWITYGIVPIPYVANVYYDEINGRSIKAIGGNFAFSQPAITAAENFSQDNNPYSVIGEDNSSAHQFFYTDPWESPSQVLLNDTTFFYNQIYACPTLGHISFAEGLGCVSAFYGFDFGVSYTRMVGYRKGSEEYGSIPGIDVVLSNNDIGYDALPVVSVYPVPATDILHFSQHITSEYCVFDITGKPVLRGMLNESFINISNLASGLYHGQLLQSGVPTATFRFLK
jgi:hypothetical protein